MEVVRRAYGDFAARYIELFGRREQVHPNDLDLIVRHLSRRPGVVLDVGCGPGHLASHLRSLDVDVIGIDMVPEFIDHAHANYPDALFELASARQLPVPDHSLTGILAWYSLIHFTPDEIGRVLVEMRRAMVPGGALVVGFFDGNELTSFDHKVVTAYRWPVDEFSARLRRAGFAEVERQQRPGDAEAGIRPHAAIAAIAD